jgi:tripartite-type tricarboxylate transporter receptor subunit TctC
MRAQPKLDMIPRRLALALPLLPWAAQAQAPAWPSRPIRLIVPFAPGGTTDVVGRLAAEKLGPRLGQPMLVENRPGAGATLGAQLVARAEPDGHTLLVSSSTSHGVSPAIYPNIGYDPIADFAHIALLSRTPPALLVTRNHPARNIQEYLELGRRERELTLAVAAIGTSSHLAGVRLGQALGVEVRSVVYRGVGPALTDVIAGIVPGIIDSLPSAVGHMRGGSLRALALLSESRSPLFPDLPTMREAGLDVVSAAWFGISAPAATPAPILARLTRETQAMLAEPETRAKLEDLGGAPPPWTPAEYTAFIRSELATLGALARAAGIKPQ